MSMARATLQMGKKAFSPGASQTDFMNFFEFWIVTAWKCNYAASV
jgi:hypothetical protein